MTTTIRQLTGANVVVLDSYRGRLPHLTNLGKTVATFDTDAGTALQELVELKAYIHGVLGGRSFENRAIVAVLNKLRDYQSGGRYAKHVSEK